VRRQAQASLRISMTSRMITKTAITVYNVPPRTRSHLAFCVPLSRLRDNAPFTRP